ncbi:MAG: ribbon-helix-helix protein, CopG family [Pseudomonadota bacterium]
MVVSAKSQTQTISVRIPDELARALSKIAEQSGRSKSSHVITALEDYTAKAIKGPDKAEKLRILAELANRPARETDMTMEEIDQHVADLREDRF